MTQGTAVLVNRGWVPLGTAARFAKPARARWRAEYYCAYQATGGQDLHAGRRNATKWLALASSGVQLELFEKDLEGQLMPLMLLLEEDIGDGLVRDWQLLEFGPEHNIGYAVQWFGLALTLLVIYLVVNTSKVH